MPPLAEHRAGAPAGPECVPNLSRPTRPPDAAPACPSLPRPFAPPQRSTNGLSGRHPFAATGEGYYSLDSLATLGDRATRPHVEWTSRIARSRTHDGGNPRSRGCLGDVAEVGKRARILCGRVPAHGGPLVARELPREHGRTLPANPCANTAARQIGILSVTERRQLFRSWVRLG